MQEKLHMQMEMDQSSVVSELEGTLLKDPDPFSYFMLVAFEASGLFRFALLLVMWPVIKSLEMIGREEAGLKLMIFVAVAGVRESEIKSVARAVLPKFCVEDVDMEAWKVFSSCDQRVVVTKMPRIMVERFVKEHLRADEVVGCELVVNRFGLATGFVKGEIGSSHFCDRVGKLVAEKLTQPTLGLGRPTSSSSSFLSLCKVRSLIFANIWPTFHNLSRKQFPCNLSHVQKNYLTTFIFPH